LSESERQDRIRARRRLRAALACLDEDLPCLAPARIYLAAYIHTIDAVIGTEDDMVPGDHDEDCRRCGVPVADGWHPKDGAMLVPVEPFRGAGLRLPSRGDCRGSYVSDLDRYRSVNPSVVVHGGADHHEREC
jgi:hypothetical protein